MFKIGNTFGGYRAHSFAARTYDRIDDSIKAIASGESEGAGIASIVISNLLSGDISGSQQAARNAAVGIATLQMFGEAVREINHRLTEMAELAIKAASGYYTDPQKYTMQLGFEELGAQVNDIVDSTKFNGNKLLSSDGKTLTISLRKADVDIIAADLGIDLTEYDLMTDPVKALVLMKYAIEETSGYFSYLGDKFRLLSKTASTLQYDIIKAMGYQTSISNTDLAEEIATETMGRIQAESVVLLQTQGKVAAAKALQLLKAA